MTTHPTGGASGAPDTRLSLCRAIVDGEECGEEACAPVHMTKSGHDFTAVRRPVVEFLLARIAEDEEAWGLADTLADTITEEE